MATSFVIWFLGYKQLITVIKLQDHIKIGGLTGMAKNESGSSITKTLEIIGDDKTRLRTNLTSPIRKIGGLQGFDHSRDVVLHRFPKFV